MLNKVVELNLNAVDSSGATGDRCVVSVEARAVVGISDRRRWDARRNPITIRSNSLSRKRTSADSSCTRGSIRIARDIHRRSRRSSAEPCEQHASGLVRTLRQASLARSGRLGACARDRFR